MKQLEPAIGQPKTACKKLEKLLLKKDHFLFSTLVVRHFAF
jgi:hypothetical protein